MGIIKIHIEETLYSTEFLPFSKFTYSNLRNFTYLKEVISQQKTWAAQLKELGSLGFLNIMGVGSEIIKTRESNPLSFSNVSSEAAEAHKVSTIIEYIEGSMGEAKPQRESRVEQIEKEIMESGIKGSVARDRNISAIHKAPVRIQIRTRRRNNKYVSYASNRC